MGKVTKRATQPNNRFQRTAPVTPRQAIAFVRKHGVVLEAAAVPVPPLAACGLHWFALPTDFQANISPSFKSAT
jgi:hypothetical protein